MPSIELDNATYQRKDGFIRFKGNFEDLIGYNYCMYKNEDFSNKWFFAFISDMKYQNPNLTYIYLETDVFQTWQFDFIFKKSFVSREMVNIAEDIAGNFLVPEGLETGEYKVGAIANVENLTP